MGQAGHTCKELGTEDPGSDRPLSEIRGWSQHMVDDLHLLASGDADEFCVCLISRP